jgi:hypothetical protein
MFYAGHGAGTSRNAVGGLSVASGAPDFLNILLQPRNLVVQELGPIPSDTLLGGAIAKAFAARSASGRCG